MSATIDQQFIEYVVKTIVGNPDAVSIKRTIDEKGVLLELTVDPEDLGRVIGKRGSGAQSLRTLLRALGTKNDARYNLKIVDVGEGRERPERPAREEKREETNEETTSKEESVAEETVKSDDFVEEEIKEAKKEESVAVESEAMSSFDRTRRELADLDDLDI
jgi:predicted RNA-binding protein YlqC (UPF0109 family)